jgi:hypothetical protein
MTRALRHIALTVEQTGRNAYGWLLIESASGKVFVLKRASRPHATYMGALDAGYQELALLSASGLHEQEGVEQESAPTEQRPTIELAELNDAI